MSDISISFLNHNDFDGYGSSLEEIIPGIVMSAEDLCEKITEFDIWEDVLAQERSGLPLNALNHSRIFQRIDYFLHPHLALKLQEEFTRIDSKLSAESVVLVINGIAWDRLVGDIVDLFEDHGIVLDPLVIGNEEEHIAFVYVENQQAAQIAINDLNGATVHEKAKEGDPKEPDSFVIEVRMATYGDVKHCLLMKGLQFNPLQLQFPNSLH